MVKIFISVLLLFLPVPLFGITIHVPGDYSTIQGAINGALDGDTIIVGPGTYMENLNIDRSIILQSNSGPESTVLNGDQTDRVIYIHNNALVTVDGFTITKGLTSLRGGGIYCHDVLSGTIICNNIITDNHSDLLGGGIHIDESPLVYLEGNTISNNYAYFGAGICCEGNENHRTIINNNDINYNETIPGGQGGGIAIGPYSSPVSVEVTNNRIANNSALDSTDNSGAGGGILVARADDFIMENNLIDGNTSGLGGGMAIYNISSSVLNNCSFIYNLSTFKGGGLYMVNCTISFENCLFAKNSAIDSALGAYGAALSVVESQTTLINTTLADNQTDLLYQWSSIDLGTNATINFTNSIVYNNWYEIGINPGSSITFDYCASDWDLSSYGGNNIITDPLFVDPSNNDYHLQQDPCQTGAVNPCVDAGDPSSAMIEGSTRTDGLQDQNIVDMGFHYPITDQPVKKVPSEYLTIQAAIDSSEACDLILVAPGTYHENIVFPDHAIEVRSDGDSDSETTDIAPAQTVIDGSQSGSVVEFTSGNGPGSVLNGFTLTNGSGKPVLNEYLGGGVYCKNASPIIQNNIITENTIAPGWLLFGFGGGIYCDASSPSILNNTISYNYVEDHGGGIYCTDSSQPSITHNTILGNTADKRGGGISCTHSSTAAITNNIIAENSADTRGGGIYCYDNSTPMNMTNNTIISNSAGTRGGGIYCNWNPIFSIVNCILWDNTSPEGPEMWIGDHNTTCLAVFCYSVVQGGTASVHLAAGSAVIQWLGMLDLDPLFVNPVSHDYHLTKMSPCIDAGSNNTDGIPSTDIDGQGRLIPFVRRYLMGQPVSPGIVDMGADEYWGARVIKAPKNLMNQ